METVVLYPDFAAALDRVRAGLSMFWVRTYMRATPIKAVDIAKFKEAGYTLLSQSADGQGFRMQQGRSRVYVMPGLLREAKL